MSDVRGKTVRMDDSLWDAVARERVRSGASEAELIRRAVILYLAWSSGGMPPLADVLRVLEARPARPMP